MYLTFAVCWYDALIMASIVGNNSELISWINSCLTSAERGVLGTMADAHLKGALKKWVKTANGWALDGPGTGWNPNTAFSFTPFAFFQTMNNLWSPFVKWRPEDDPVDQYSRQIAWWYVNIYRQLDYLSITKLEIQINSEEGSHHLLQSFGRGYSSRRVSKGGTFHLCPLLH